MNDSEGRTRLIVLSPIREGPSVSRRIRVRVPCTQECVLTGLAIRGPIGRTASGSFTLDRIRTLTGGPVAPGPSSDWEGLASTDPDPDAEIGSMTLTESADAGAIGATFYTAGESEVLMNHAWAPSRLPALVLGDAGAAETEDGSFLAPGLDGLTRPFGRVGSLVRVPGSSVATAFVSLPMLLRDGVTPDSSEDVQIWFSRDGVVLFDKVSAALQAADIEVLSISSLGDVRRPLDRSTPTWSLALAIVSGGGGLVLAALVLIVVAVTTWRTRARDLAGLRMSGLTRRAAARIATLEQLPVIVLAVVAGAISGVVGAHFALPTVPLFVTPPEVSTLDLSTAWGAVMAATAAALGVLGAVGWLAGRVLAHRARLERVREAL